MPRRHALRWVVLRVLHAVALLWGVATLLFVLIELSPGSVADRWVDPQVAPEVRALTLARLGLDRPAPVRYVAMLADLARLDLGTSLASSRPVVEVVGEALPNTLLLSGVTLAVLWPLGIGLGLVQALRRERPVGAAVAVGGLLLWSVPEFWLALMLQVVAARVGLPISGAHDAVTWEGASGGARVGDTLLHLLLPGVAMGLASAAGVARYVRSSVLEVLDADFVRAARAKGLPPRAVLVRHVLPNALLPILPLLGLSLPGLVAGSVVVESVFGWPGTGRLVVDAVHQQDTPVIVGCFLLFATLVMVGNLLADLAHAALDPRVSRW